MSKEEYISKNFSEPSLEIIGVANKILHKYDVQGYTLTLRQLYYQFVALALLENTDRNYKRLGSIISDARLAGLVDWSHMVDRTRHVNEHTTWLNPGHILSNCSHWFALDRWEGQTHRPEVWVEKDALIDIVAQACEPYQVPYFSCRGYTSQSSMWEAAKRLSDYEGSGQEPVVIHLGDHDPSGIDMTRDIEDRLNLFTGGIRVKRIALNYRQVEKYKPPPNPTKLTDSRSGAYLNNYGHDSWELDALEPDVLKELIQKTVTYLIDDEMWDEVVEKEAAGKEYLSELAARDD